MTLRASVRPASLGAPRAVSCLLAVAVAASPARATILNTGDVVFSGTDLRIGNTADGSRAVDAETDGPYDSVSVGVVEGVTGALTLDHGASFLTTGTLVAGIEGEALLRVVTGSTLESGGSVLGSADIGVGGGSAWISDGVMNYTSNYTIGSGYSEGPVILVTDGAIVSTNGVGVSHSGLWSGADGIDLTIEGPGSAWMNDGLLRLGGRSSFSVLNGAIARDAGVELTSSSESGAICAGTSFESFGSCSVVDGVGSTWDTDSFFAGDFALLSVRNGGCVNSSSAMMDAVLSGPSIEIEGAQSTWSIAGALESRADGLHLSVSGGATLESGEAGLYSYAYQFVTVSGTGSLWDVRGSLVADTLYNRVVVDQGASLVAQGNSTFSSSESLMEVRDAESMFRTEGSLTLRPLQSPPLFSRALLAVAGGAKVEAGAGMTAFDGGEIELHGGSLATPSVVLQGGSLSGEGMVDADVLSGGRVAPGVGFGPLIATAFEQGSEGVFAVELAGTEPDLEVPRLEVLGIAQLAGRLEISLADSYNPALGDSYEVLHAGSRAGEFDTYVGPDVGEEKLVVPIYEPDGVWLRVVLRDVCGNTIVDVDEACDDGNAVSGDGCDSNCTATGCGNTIVTGGEQCDDGNVIEDDGCDSSCQENFGSQTRRQRQCIVNVNRGIARIARAEGKQNERCLTDAAEGRLAASPTALDDCIEADSRNEVARAQQVLRKLERSGCSVTRPPELALGPDHLQGSVAASTLAIQLVRDLLGDPPASAPKSEPEAARCQIHVLRQASKLFETVLSEIRASTAGALKGRNVHPVVNDQQLSSYIERVLRSSLAIRRADRRLRATVTSTCESVPDLPAILQGCQVPDAAGAATCASRVARCRACELLLEANQQLTVDCDALGPGDVDLRCSR